MLVACGGLVFVALAVVGVRAAVSLPFLERSDGPVGVLDLLPKADELLPAVGSDPLVHSEVGNQFLESAAVRLGFGAMPPEALPAAARAYRAQFGHSMDEDLPEYADDIDEWLVNWRAAYDAGAPWATAMTGQ